MDASFPSPLLDHYKLAALYYFLIFPAITIVTFPRWPHPIGPWTEHQ